MEETKNQPTPVKAGGYGPWAAACAVAVFAGLLYSNTLSVPFQFDDSFYIVENRTIRDLANFWPPVGTRYLGYLSFALNYHFGGLDAGGYHVVNTFIHAINAALVFGLVYLIMKTPRMTAMASDPGRRPGSAMALAVSVALLFAAHPVQTEAVTYATQRFASLTTMFYLSALVLFVAWRAGRGRRGGKWGGVALYAFALVATIAAQKTKEFAFTLPFVLVFFDLVFFESLRELPPARRVRYLMPFLAVLVIIPFELFGPSLGISIGESLNEMVRKDQMRDLGTMSGYEYLITQFRVIVTYLRLLVWPSGLNVDYDFPLYPSLLRPGVLASLALLLAIAGSALYSFLRGLRTGSGYAMLYFTGVVWFFTTLSVESSVIPIKDVAVEHRLYLPSVGAALAFSALIFALFDRFRAGDYRWPLAVVIIIALVVPLSASTWSRNTLWQDPVAMVEDIVKKSPRKATAHYLLGNVYAERGRTLDAIRAFEKAAELDPDDAFTRYRLYNSYMEIGRPGPARHNYNEFMRLMSEKRRSR